MCQTLQSGILGIIQRENTAWREKNPIGEGAASFGCTTASRGQGSTRRKGVPGPRRNHKTNIGLPDAGHRRLNRRGEGREATLFGITLPSTCWELGVKRFTYSKPFSRHRRVSLLARLSRGSRSRFRALGDLGCFAVTAWGESRLIYDRRRVKRGDQGGCGVGESVVEKGVE